MTTRTLIRPPFARPATRPIRKAPARRCPVLEALEDRLAPAVQLTYGGPGTALSLRELAGGATPPTVSISEPVLNQLRIDLGAQTFDPQSTTQATGLAYENPGAPGASHFAVVDISQSNSISTLQANLAGDALTLGRIADASGGLGNVAASAGAITVVGLDTAHASTGSGNVDLKAAGPLTVAGAALLTTGTGTISLAAGVNADGTGSSGGGKLSIASGATVPSDNTGSSAITLRGTTLDIATGPDPAVVGAHRVGDSATPGATLTAGLAPDALAFDAAGNLYVANFGDGTVSKFAPDGSPLPSLSVPNQPTALLSDGHNLWVANQYSPGTGGGTVSQFDQNGNLTGTIEGLYSAVALASDNGKVRILYTADPTGNQVGVFFGVPGDSLFGIIPVGSMPEALAVDGNNNLFVANFGDSTVNVLTPITFTPSANLTGLDLPLAMAFFGNRLYVANDGDNTVSVFTLAYDGNGHVLPSNTTPSATLTGLKGPRALAFDAHGNLFVANEGGNTVSVFAPGSTTPSATLSGLNGPAALAFDAHGNLFVANNGGLFGSTVSEFTPTPVAGGVVIRTARPDQLISLGATSGPGLALSDAELAQIFTTGALTIGDPTYTGDITVASNVTQHPGYATLSLQTTEGSINTAPGATLAVASLALQAGTGIGTTGNMAINAAQLAFASQSGPIHLRDASAVTLTSVAMLPASSIPGNVFSAPQVGDVSTLLGSGGVSGRVTYQGQALQEGATLTLGDGQPYRISYQAGTTGHDVTLTRLADPSPEQQFVGALYRAVLGREADGAEKAIWVGLLQAGGTRQQVAEGLWDSPEHRGLQVDRFYATYLHRAADPSGRTFWVSALLDGVSEEQVAAAFLTSAEYQHAHPDLNDYLSGLYADALGRAPDADGLASWQAAAQGGLGRERLADSFLQSREEQQQLLNQYYADYLDRPGDPVGVAAWLSEMQSSQLSPEQVAQAFLVSVEFYDRALG
jgi:hypothetical protein